MKNIYEELKSRILILDGAMGTMLQQQGLKAEDFGGQDREGCNEILNITRPDVVRRIHEAYLEAGADIIETNTFGAARVVLAEYNLADRDIELNREAAKLAREAADRFSVPEKPRFVAGSMGPTTKMLSLTGGITYDEMEEAYYRQAVGLLAGGADLFLIETCQDTLNVKAAGTGISRAMADKGRKIPVMVSCTIEPSGTMLAGQNIEAFYISISHLKPLAAGLNCGTGAGQMNEHLRTLGEIASCAVSCYPNAGLPDEEGVYREEPEEFARKMKQFALNGWLNIAGGCCGTTDRHIKALSSVLKGCPPRSRRAPEKSGISGIEPVWPEEDNRPLLVGERSNVIGSRKFKELIAEERFEEGSEIARTQVRKGAQVVDICLANPDRDELADMTSFLPYVLNKVKSPLMLDSTDPAVLEAGLKLIQGKVIINSVNLENGLDRLDKVIPLLKEYGAAVVAGLIDEEGMALTRERKLALAERSYDLLVNTYGLSPADIIFDPLTFPVGTGDANYQGSAVETIEGLKKIKNRFPECKTILGISNVSFGLPPAGREVLNAVFLYLNTLAGLDYAIVNSEKLRRYASIPQEEKNLAQDLLLNTNEITLSRFTDYYRDRTVSALDNDVILPLEERLANYIVEGMKEGLAGDLQEALTKYSALDIINGPLMKGMEEVGRLFDENQLIVAEVLQSAEVMKTAVTFLKPYLKKTEEAVKGRILLATVKGDVHDIGKNLVEIILANNGYEVVNLGVKVGSEQIIAAVKRENPDAVGLSGLLVKSVQQMLLTAQDLRAENIDVPLILGGAALTRKFTDERIAPAYGGNVFYAKDALDGLRFLKEIKNSLKIGNGKVKSSPADQDGSFLTETNTQAVKPEDKPQRSARINNAYPFYKPRSIKRELVLNYDLAEVIPYLNVPLLIRRYLGIDRVSAGEIKAVEKYRAKVEEFTRFFQDFLSEIKDKQLITLNGVYAFFPVRSEGNKIFVCDPVKGIELEEFVFPRQSGEQGLCLADYIRSESKDKMDYLGFFAVTAGQGARERAEKLKNNGEYLKSYLLQALAMGLVEAFAEVIHQKMRSLWGFPDKPEQSAENIRKGKYQGIRVSPGYSVCPDLGLQKKIFNLLRPEEAGILLTETLMMDPEASITALVFSHPESRIFPVKQTIFEETIT